MSRRRRQIVKDGLGLFLPNKISGLALWLDGSDSSTITGTTDVTSWADKSGNGYDFAVAGSGNNVSYADSVMSFDGGKYLSIDDSSLRDVLSVGGDSTVIVLVENIENADAALFASSILSNNLFILSQRANSVRAAHYNGSSYLDVQTFAQQPETKKTIYSTTWNGSDTRALRVNGGDVDENAGNPVASSTQGTAIGAATNGTLNLTGGIRSILVYDRVLSDVELGLIEAYLTGTKYIVGIGQSNEELSFSTTSPYARDGFLALTDTANALSGKTLAYYIDGAVSGSYVSKRAYDAAGQTSNNYWVDDTVNPFVAGPNLTQLKTLISDSGITGNSIDFTVAHLESEAYRVFLGDLTKQDVKDAINWLFDDIANTYPQATFNYQLIGYQGRGEDGAYQTMRDIELELISERDDTFYAASMVDQYNEVADPTHYSPAGYAAAGTRKANWLYRGVTGAEFSSASLSGNVLTLNFNHNQGTGWAQSDLTPVNNLLADSRAFDNWTATGATVTANQATGFTGEESTADLVSKTASFQRITKGVTTTAGVHTASVYMKENTLDDLTILISGNNTSTLNGFSYYDLSTGSIVDRGSANYVDSSLEELGNGWMLCTLTAELPVVTNPVLVLYPGQHNSATAGSVYLDGAQVTKTSSPYDYAPQNGAIPWVYVEDDGVFISPTSISASGDTVTVTLSSTPAGGSSMKVYGGFDDLKFMQRQTIPIDNSIYALPSHHFKHEFTA